MNSITIAGNCTKDAEVRFLPNGDAVASFGLADNMGKDKGAIFWNCSLFGKRGESLAGYLLKGTPVTVSGSVSERSYTDKDGNQRKSMDVRVNDVALQGGKRDDAPQQAPRPTPQTAPRQAPARAAPSGFDPSLDDGSDIPF